MRLARPLAAFPGRFRPPRMFRQKTLKESESSSMRKLASRLSRRLEKPRGSNAVLKFCQMAK